jgi:HSP20 family protein
MNLIRFNNGPRFNNMLSELFEDFDRNLLFRNEEFNGQVPSVNIRETEEGFALEMAAPGMKKDDFKIRLNNQVLTISAENKVETEEKKGSFTRREFAYGTFTRSFSLPKSIDLDKIKADYENGILKLALPKREDAKVNIDRQIAIA